MAEPKTTIGIDLVKVHRAFAVELGMEAQLSDFPEVKKAALNVRSAWFEVPFGEWMAAFRLLIQGGMPVIAELRVFPAENYQYRPKGEWSGSLKGTDATAPAGGLTIPVIRQIKIGTFRRKIAEILKEFRQAYPETMKSLNLVVEPEQKKNPNEKRGRPPLADIFYARIADCYARRCNEESPTPVLDTAKRFRVKKEKVRAWLHAARTRGFLTGGGKQGTGFGELTSKARLLLQREKSHKKGK